MTTIRAEEPTTRIMYYGSDEPLPAPRLLRAGPLSVTLDGVDLRHIRLGEREVLRRVYVAVRDRNWDTIPGVISAMQVDARADAFDLSFDVRHSSGEIDFTWHGTISGSVDGTISYVMDGVARSTFMKNRIGFCILHPMACAGVPCTIRHVDGSDEEGAFPVYISPHQPFLEFEAITHDVAPGVRAEVRLGGDIFEMEDQRNWTDASYKIYSTPLRLPYPVEVREGERITQTFSLSLQGSPSTGVDQEARPVTVTVDRAATRALPSIGLGMASHGRPLGEREAERLRALHLTHLRVDLDLADSDYAATLQRASGEARMLGVPLEIALFLSDNAEQELAALSTLLAQQRPDVVRWLVFHTDEKSTSARWISMARQALATYQPEVPVGAGTNAYFTELNRERPPVDLLDCVVYSVNPQVHAFDNVSLTESVAAQAATLESARQFCGDRPLVVSPITLKPRFNPNATGPAPAPAPDELPPEVDARQMSLFGAGWTLGSLKYQAEGGASSLTYYETTGWRGVMESASSPGAGSPGAGSPGAGSPGAGSPGAGRFHSTAGMLFPLYYVLADAGEMAGAAVLGSTSSDPLHVESLVLDDGAHTRVLLANMTGTPQDVRVDNLPVGDVRVRLLDEHSFERATRDGEAFRREPGERRAVEGGALQLTLPPYAVARIEGEGGTGD